jgi:enoyl-CoA hydratase/carnithine racemase
MIAVEIQDRIATVRFDRGDGVNALSAAAMRELADVARRFAGDPSVSAVILAGAQNFSLGADLKDPERGAGAQGIARRRLTLRAGPEMCEAWEKVDALTICAIEG